MNEQMQQILDAKPEVEPLDYSKVKNWIINANADINKPYDLIFFCGTSIFKSDSESGVGEADNFMSDLGYQNYVICGSQLSENARIFCPLQRQIALDYALGAESHKDLMIDIATKEPYVDLEAALDYYFENFNPSAKRPFVLGGHSQGASSLQVALCKYFLATDKKDYLKNMIAAYALGYGVSKFWFDNLPNKEGRIHFVEGEDDYNCLISWNVEGAGSDKGVSFLLADEEYGTLLVNPLNWKTDDTYAGIDENLGVLNSKELENGNKKYEISILPEDLCDAQIDLKRGCLICSTRKDYVTIPGVDHELWGGKSLHQLDGPAYYNNIKTNLRLRVKNFLKDKEAEKK